MTILNFKETYSTVADDTSGAIYCYTLDDTGNKKTHRVLFARDLAKVVSTLSIPSARNHRNIYIEDYSIIGGHYGSAKKHKKVYVQLFPMENLPMHNSMLAKRMKKAIYTHQDTPIASYNKMASTKGWELLRSNDNNNTEYVTSETNTITEVEPLRITLPKFSLAEENERLNKQVSTLMVQLATIKEEQGKQASLLQQMFLLLSTWFATLGGVQKRT